MEAQAQLPNAATSLVKCTAPHHAALLVVGEDVTVDMEKNVLINHTTGKEYALKALGDVSCFGPEYACSRALASK